MTTIDLQTTPLSRRGSWMSLSLPQKPEYQPMGPGLYLRSNHARGIARRELFLIEMLMDETVVQPAISADVVSAKMTFKEACVEIVFSREEGVRIKWTNCRIRLTAVPGENSTAYCLSPKAWTFNLRSSIRRYHCQVLTGDAMLQQKSLATHTNFESGSMVLNTSYDNNGSSELAIDAYWSAWHPRHHPDFDVLKNDIRNEFEAFCSAMPNINKDWTEASHLASYILWSCTQSPCGQLKHEAVFMSLNWMDQVWSWDNVFNLCALAAAHPELAMNQMRCAIDLQDEFGAYPDGWNDMFRHYNFSKPPVHGILLDWVAKNVKGFWTIDRQRELYPSLAKFAHFWLNHRLDEKTGLAFYLHGNDSGQDNSTLLDKGAPLITPDLAAYLISLMQLLEQMAVTIGNSKESAEWATRHSKMLIAMIQHLWKDDRFVAIKADTGENVWSESNMLLMPLVLGESLPENIRRHLMEAIKPLITQYGLATENPSSPLYSEDGYWRGPIWAPTTFLFAIGLEKCGEKELAKELCQRFCETCNRGGFAENFNALTGAPLRDRAYTWTASAFICMAMKASA